MPTGPAELNTGTVAVFAVVAAVDGVSFVAVGVAAAFVVVFVVAAVGGRLADGEE